MTKHEKIIWAAGFFDGEGCVNISRPVNKRTRKNGDKYEHTSHQMVVVVAQRDRRPMDQLVELFGGGLSTAKIHGSTYWYFRRHGVKAAAVLNQLLPYLVLKGEAAEMALAFQKYLDETRKVRRNIGRTANEISILDAYYEYSRSMNARYKEKDWTAGTLTGVQ